MEKFKVTFYPDNKTVEVSKDTTLLSAAVSAGVSINSACGGDGVCGKCKVIVKSGHVLTQPNGAVSLDEKKRNIYLACLTTVHSALEVEVPPESRLDFEKLSDEEAQLRLKGLYSASEEIEPQAIAQKAQMFTFSPFATKLYLELPKPTLEDTASDLERLYREIRKARPVKDIQTGLVNIWQLGELLRDSDWKVTVALGRRDDALEILFVEPGDTSSRNFGFAFDIGTTTISGQLVDLNTKKIIGTKAAYNKQASFGSDVITRIIFAGEENGLEKLHNAVTDTMNEIIKGLAREHGVDLNDALCVLCSGNTTMIHLLLRVDPAYIRREPYVPTANFVPTIRAQEVGVKINPRGLLSCVPGVSSYVGGDTTAGVLSCGLYKEEELNMLIDIGTNGEIVLGSREFLVGCAASAGPAFEGSGVSCGMRASKGAIQKVKINQKGLDVSFDTIAKAKPRGICGSGYIELIAELLRIGVIDRSGKIIAQDNRRIRQGDSGKEFIVAFKDEADSSSDIYISEADIENLKRAKAAIYSACSVLVRHMSLDFARVKKIFIAGGFGTFLDIESAVKIGILPDLERKKFVFVGNSALAGAREMLLSAEAVKKADELARQITYFELSVDAGYMDEYMAALFFPHTDLDKFPSAR